MNLLNIRWMMAFLECLNDSKREHKELHLFPAKDPQQQLKLFERK